MAAIAKALGLLALLGLLSACGGLHGENEAARFSPGDCVEGWNAAVRSTAATADRDTGGVRWTLAE